MHHANVDGAGSGPYRQRGGTARRIRAGGLERDVTFAEAAPDQHPVVDAAYHAKYDQYGPAMLGSVVGQQAREVTVRLLPRT